MSRTRKFPSKEERKAYALGRLDERKYIASELQAAVELAKLHKDTVKAYIEGKKVQHG